MNLRQLQYFCAAVQMRNVTRAAERLHVAQPALGQHIRLLEAELGVTLLQRHSRGVTPTAAGDRLNERAQEMFLLLDRTRREVIELGQGKARSVTLGLTPSLTLLIGADLQLTFPQDQPGRPLILWEDPSFRLVGALERGELDLALVYDAEPRAGLALQAVLDEELLYVCPPDRAPACERVTLADLDGVDLALGSSQDVGRRAVARAARCSPDEVRVRYEVQSISGIRELLLRGSAASVMPYGTVAHELRAGRLVARRFTGEAVPRSTLCVATRAAAGSPSPLHDAGIAQLVDLAVRLTLDSQPQLAVRRAVTADGGMERELQTA